MALFDPALLEYVDEQKAFNSNIMEATKALGSIDTATPEGLAWIRDAMKPGGLFGFQTYDFPVVREIDGPAGAIPIRIMTPEVVNGVYLHYHGGGMTMGSALAMDARNWQIAEACSVAVVSVDYRLAPEHPFPAGPDDAEAAAIWLIDNAAGGVRDRSAARRRRVGRRVPGAADDGPAARPARTYAAVRRRRPVLRRLRLGRHAEFPADGRQGSVRDR